MAIKKAAPKKAAAKAKVSAAPKRKTTAISEKMTKTQILTEIAENTGLNRKQVGDVMAELEILIERSIKKRALGEFTIPGLMKITTVKKPATKARKGINPFIIPLLLSRLALNDVICVFCLGKIDMPIYEYACRAREHEFEALQKMSDPALTECPECKANELFKKISAAGFRLKGGGWYETDFKSGGKKKNLAGDGGASGTPAASSSSD